MDRFHFLKNDLFGLKTTKKKWKQNDQLKNDNFFLKCRFLKTVVFKNDCFKKYRFEKR